MTRFDYAYWDSAVQSGIAYDKHYGWSNNNGPTFNLNNFHTDFSTNYTINGFGQTTAALVNDGVAKSVAYTLDVGGQIVRRKETRTSNASQAAPVEVFYRYAGKTMGMVGNNGTGDVDYNTSITQRSAASPAITSTNAGLFRNGTNNGSASYADFSQSIDPYNSGQQGSAGGGTYTVRQGDTLQAIAAALYGDGAAFVLPQCRGHTIACPRFATASRKPGDTEYDVPVLLPFCSAQPTTLDESPNPV